LLKANFEGIRSDADGVTWKWMEKRRLDVPDIAFLNAGILFDINLIWRRS